MRTAIIVETFPVPSETFIYRHVRGLRADVVALRVDEAYLEGCTWEPHISCLRRGKQRRERLHEKVVRRLKEVTVGVPAPHWTEDMHNLWERYVAHRKPDVALAEFGPNGMRAIDACRKHGVPLVVHFHGYDTSSLLRFKSYRERLPAIFSQAAALIVVSRRMRETLARLGCAPSKLHVIPCGAPVEEFRPSGNVARQPCRFIAVARFVGVKGPLLTLRAFARCCDQCPGVTLNMIGSGHLLGAAETWVRDNGLSEKVRFLGEQPVETVREHLMSSGAFAQHSVTMPKGAVEGWGVSMAEAAASGLPVVATRHGGIPDHVVDGKTGFLVEERDWSAMADKMILLARNAELRREMGFAGRCHIERVGNCRIQIRRLREVLAQSCAS